MNARQHIRDHVSHRVDEMDPGDLLRSEKIAKDMTNGSRSVTSRTIGCILREREDLERVCMGVWRRV